MLAFFAFGLSLALTPMVLLLLRRHELLDHPNERSSHNAPVPRGAGIAVALASVTAVLVGIRPAGLGASGVGVLVAAVGLGAIGLAEDIWGVPPLRRFILQLVACGVPLMWLLSGLDGVLLWRVAFGLGSLLALAAYANVFNFMDGIDGISGTQSLLAGAAWLGIGLHQGVETLSWGGAVLLGATLGFLPYNLPRARIILGDVGSYFLGGWQAALVIVGLRAGIPPEAVAAPIAVYLADTGVTLARRVSGGEVWHQPHREHAYQLLIRQGWSHPRTTAFVGACIAVTSGLGLASLGPPWARAIADVLGVLVLMAYVAFPHLRAGRASGLRTA